VLSWIKTVNGAGIIACETSGITGAFGGPYLAEEFGVAALSGE